MSSFLENLPEISFADTDTETIEQAVITTYEGIAGVTLYPGDPVRLFLEALSALIAQQRVIIDTTGKMNLLAYSTGDYLDQLGAFTETERLGKSKATTTVRFSIASVLGFAVPIPAGTRVTPDSQLMFQTTAYAEITAGQTYVDVEAECQLSGSVGNDFVAGQVNKLVDPIDYITTVSNTSKSDGGADTEDDDSYRLRVHQAPEKYSVAGPDEAYIYWAMTASQQIIDVAVYSPAEGEVNVRPLLDGGEIPGSEILSLVEDTLTPKAVRPLTDSVTVQAPDTVNYDITATYYIASSSQALAGQIQDAVDGAVDAYILWQKSALGRDINPSELETRIMTAGAKRVVIANPAFTALDVWEVAQDATIAVTYGGLEED